MVDFVSTDAEPGSIYIAAFAVTPSDTVDIPEGPCRGIICDGTGNSSFIRMTLVGNEDDTYVTIPITHHDTKRLAAKRIWATGTTASSVFALY